MTPVAKGAREVLPEWAKLVNECFLGNDIHELGHRYPDVRRVTFVIVYVCTTCVCVCDTY